MRTGCEAGARLPILEPDRLQCGFQPCCLLGVTPCELPFTYLYNGIVTIPTNTIGKGGIKPLAQGLAQASPHNCDAVYCPRTGGSLLGLFSLLTSWLTMKSLPLVTKTFYLKTLTCRKGTRSLELWPLLVVKEEILRALGGQRISPQTSPEEVLCREHKTWL